MNRTNPTFRHEALSAEEADSFLDELFTELFDNDLTENSDATPDLGKLDRLSA